MDTGLDMDTDLNMDTDLSMDTNLDLSMDSDELELGMDSTTATATTPDRQCF